MKVLTITQPWATLIAVGAKKIETRSWFTYYRGPLAIHAAKGFPDYAWMACHQEPFYSVLAEKTAILRPEGLPRSEIVATCELVDVVKVGKTMPSPITTFYKGEEYIFDLNQNELAFGDYSEGRYLWLLANIKPLEPTVPAKGKLGLWEWDEKEISHELK